MNKIHSNRRENRSSVSDPFTGPGRDTRLRHDPWEIRRRDTEWLYKSPSGGFPLLLAWEREYLGEIGTPASVPAILPIPSFIGRVIGNVRGIDQVYVERGAQSSNDSISFSVLTQGTVIFTV